MAQTARQNENGNWWSGKPWRLIQTNLREIDMLDIEAERYVEELQKFKANIVMINTSGIIASYETDLPFHFQSPYLKGDSLQQIIDACHRAGIRVIARTDFSKVRKPIYEAHPEWAYVSPQGQIVDYNGDIHVCVNSEYQQRYALDIMVETVTKLDVDGIFFNMGGYQTRDYSGNYYGICHCDNCRRKFASMFDAPLPTVEDPQDPLYQKYMLFKKATLREHHEKVYRFLKEVRPDLCIANHLEFNDGFIRQESNTAIDRPLPHWQYSASDNTKWAVCSYPGMISSNTTVDFIDFPYRHVAVSPHQQELRLAQNLANGGALDYYLIGRLDNHEDRSGFEKIKRMFHYHEANEKEYTHLESAAQIALLHGRDGNVREFRGWFRFLTENHFPFDTLMVESDYHLPWDRYKLIIVPDYQPLSDELAARLDQFAANGGTVVSVSRSGFLDDVYRKRETPALQCLGLQRIKNVRSDMTSTYFKFESKQGFPRFADTDLLYFYGNYVYAEYKDDVQSFMKLIPPHWYGPPERCYYTTVTDHPGYTVHRYGIGQGIYIPWEPGTVFYRQGYPNTTDFIADLLEHTAGVEPIKGNLSPMVEATLFRQTNDQAHLLHLVNGSGHFGVSFFESVVMHNVQVKLPWPQAPRSVTSLVSGQTCRFDWRDGVLEIQVDKLNLFEAIKILD